MKAPECRKGSSLNAPRTLLGEDCYCWLVRGSCTAGEELSGGSQYFRTIKQGNGEIRPCWPPQLHSCEHQKTCLLAACVHADPSHAGRRPCGRDQSWSTTYSFYTLAMRQVICLGLDGHGNETLASSCSWSSGRQLHNWLSSR